LPEDYEVIPLRHTKTLHPNSVKLNITARKQVLNLLTKLKPDVAVHAASETNVNTCEIEGDHVESSVKETRNIAETCKNTGAKFVYISTDYFRRRKRQL